MENTDSPRLPANLRTEALDQRVLVYDPNGGMVVELNATAGLVIQLCDGDRTVGEITDALTDAYPQSADQVASEVPAIIEQLAERGVLEWS